MSLHGCPHIIGIDKIIKSEINSPRMTNLADIELEVTC